jgi:hypothetical protein
VRFGKPVAKLIPCDEQGDSEDEALAKLHAAAKKSGIAYTFEQLTAPIPVEAWHHPCAVDSRHRNVGVENAFSAS